MVDLIENLLGEVREFHAAFAWKASHRVGEMSNNEWRDRQRLIERAESFLRDYKARHEMMVNHGDCQ